MTPADAKLPLDEPIYERSDVALVDWHYEPDGTIQGHEYREGYSVQTGKILVHDKRRGLARDVHQLVYTLAQPGHKARDKELVDFLADGTSCRWNYESVNSLLIRTQTEGLTNERF